MGALGLIRQMLKNNDASRELINDAEIVYETLKTDYKLNFIRVINVFRAFVEIHSYFRRIGWENQQVTDTIKYDIFFMLVWSRLLKKSKPLLLDQMLDKPSCVTNLVIACLYLAYCIQGIEISYPLKPFLPYVEKNVENVEIARKRYIIYSLSTKVISDHFSMAILQEEEEA